MNGRPALLALSAPALFVFLQCAGGSKRASPPMDEPLEAGSELPDGQAGGAGGVAGDAEVEKPPRPDPALVQKVLDRAAAAPVEAQGSTLGLRFEVAEIGPGAPWAFAVVNRGSEPAVVAFDPRLLTLELEPPVPEAKTKQRKPKPKTRVCRLPDELRPSYADPRYAVRLEPGQGMVEAFDPHLYCLPEQGVSPLAAGVRVSARFGWRPKTKVVWKKGKRVEELLPQTDPFVARPAPPLSAGDDAGAEEGADAEALEDAGSIAIVDGGAPPGHEVKELGGSPFELGADYAPPVSHEPETLTLDLTRGSDAKDETGAQVTLAIKNRSKKPVRLYFRREFVSFQVLGPDGAFSCDPQPDGRSPDRQAFSLLNPGGSLSATSRLVELCPDDTFARPGLYHVRAELHAVTSGQEYGFDAFRGRLSTTRAVIVRVRSGSLPFPGRRVLEPVQVGEAR